MPRGSEELPEPRLYALKQLRKADGESPLFLFPLFSLVCDPANCSNQLSG